MKRYKNFLFLLYLITLIFGCQSDDQASSMLPETAVPTNIAVAASETPIPTQTEPPIQPTNPPVPTITATPQPTNTPPPTPTPTATPINWKAVQNGATIFYYYPSLFPIWRLAANGLSQPEVIIEEGYLFGVIPAWQE
jgi:hypothetical protein